MSRTSGVFTPAMVVAAFLFPYVVAVAPLSPHQLAQTKEDIIMQGRVVNSENGQPIRAALVQLVGSQTRAALTSTDGSFRFEGLADGDVLLMVRKPGYFSPQEYRPQSVGPQQVHLSPDLPPIELKLYPEAVIFGRVTNENGRPLEGMGVELRRMGTKRTANVSGGLPSAITNENGEYRIAELRGGSYLISVSPQANIEPISSFFRASTKRTGYPTYFYPSVTDGALATPVHLTPGKQFQADIRMARQPLYRITGSVTGARGETQIIVFAIGQHSLKPAAGSVLPPGLANFVLEGVPPGSYLLGAVQPAQNGESGEKLGVIGIEVTQDVEAALIALSEDQMVPVRFRYEYAKSGDVAAAGIGASLTLMRTDLPLAYGVKVATLTAKPEAPEEGYGVKIGQGTYRLNLVQQTNRCVASVTSGTTDLLKEDLVVPAGGAIEPIEVVVRDDCARVGGTVTKDSRPVTGRVLLLPEEAVRRGVATVANSDGLFQIFGLVPGKYLAVALEDGDDLEPDDPDTLTRVKSLATAVELEPSGSASLKLELSRLEQ